VCDPQKTMAPRVAKRGFAGPECPQTTLMALLAKAAEIKGDKPALLVERPLPPLDKDGKAPPALPREKWKTWTIKDYHTDVRRCAKAFVALGMKPFESVNVWGFNSPEWVIGAIGAMHAGGKSAGLYPTDTAETAAYKVVHSCGALVVMEDYKKVKPLAEALSARGDCKRLLAFVVWGSDPSPGEKVAVAGCGELPVLSWSGLLEMGNTHGSDDEINRRIAAIEPGHCAALIYTSGTTGMPKAVMISHDNIVYETLTVLSVVGSDCGFGVTASEERVLSYLPLSHVAAMMIDMIVQIVMASLKPGYLALFFARPYDLKAKAIKDRLQVCQPTLFFGVPLVWERIADQIRTLGAEVTGLKKSLATWAKGLSLDHQLNCQMGGTGQVPTGLSLADSLILSKIKDRLGLAKCKFGATGAAPLRKDTLEYFGSLGLHINEVYGMSESSAAATMSTNRAHVWGSCGWAIPGSEVKVFLVDPSDINKKKECPRAPDLDCVDEKYQGELCYRGRHIMMGYMACPDFGADHIKEINQKTAETIDADGWLHSGDKGMITELGLTKITGRYKELIIGEGGENIAPVPIEDEVKKACDGVNEIMMVGDKRKYCVALITLKAVGANGEVPGTDDLDAGAKRVNPDVTTISAAMKDKAWIEAVTQAINAANANGKVCPNAAFKIQKFTILPTNFSEEAGELTPTKKLKRKHVETLYAAMIEKMYTTDGVYIPYSG